jgi:phosphatidylinositol alpha-1,6-mannosyltransferase
MAKRVSVLFLATDCFGGKGGIAQYNRDLAAALAASPRVSGVTVLPRSGHTSGGLPAGVRQERAIAGRSGWSLRALALAGRVQPGLVVCGHLNAAPVGAMAAAAARAPLWLQLHGCEAWNRRSAAWRIAVRRARLTTAVSRYTRQRFTEWTEVESNRVRVLPNTVGQETCDPADQGRILARHSLAGRTAIVTVGRLAASERYKGHDRIIAALPCVRARVPDVVYLIVGWGDDEARLRALAVEHGVSDRVVFTGAVSAEDLRACLALSKVFAMPSTGEGFGIAFLEAAVAGLPVIGGNRDGSVDALADGAIGRLVDPLDCEALTRALVDGLEGRISAAPERAQRFAVRNFANHVDALLEEVLAPPEAVPAFDPHAHPRTPRAGDPVSEAPGGLRSPGPETN